MLSPQVFQATNDTDMVSLFSMSGMNEPIPTLVRARVLHVHFVTDAYEGTSLGRDIG